MSVMKWLERRREMRHLKRRWLDGYSSGTHVVLTRMNPNYDPPSASLKPAPTGIPAASTVLDGAMHSVWLHSDWRWLTRNMTTEEREAAADAVERYWVVLHDGPEDDVSAETLADLRWWLQ